MPPVKDINRYEEFIATKTNATPTFNQNINGHQGHTHMQFFNKYADSHNPTNAHNIPMNNTNMNNTNLVPNNNNNSNNFILKQPQ